MVNGIINIYKEQGFTSFDVVAKLRGIFHQKKIGHTGTLDPDAVGVLPVCLGNATKVCELLTDKDKEYEAVLLLGQETDTQDISGTVLHTGEVCVTEEEVRRVIGSFTGVQEQLPPMYSALKVNGQKLCDLARQGITVERKPRTIEIKEIEILAIELPEVRMRVHCSKGTYIRTLCTDIGAALGCYGCMKALTRTRVAGFCLADALTIGQVQQLLEENKEVNPIDIMVNNRKMIQMADSLFENYPKIRVKDSGNHLLVNGNRLPEEHLLYEEALNSEIRYRVYDMEDLFFGIYTWNPEKGDLKPVKVFISKEN